MVEMEPPLEEMDSMELYESRDVELDLGTIAEIDAPEEITSEERTLHAIPFEVVVVTFGQGFQAS